VRALHDRPQDGVEHLLTPHPTGLSALCAPADPVSADYLNADESFAVVDELIKLDRPVILDTAGGISDFTLGALDRATEVVLVCGTDVPSVQAVKKLLETMDRLGMDTSHAHLVVNRSTSRCGLSVGDVETAIGRKAELEVPEHQSLAAGMNQGCPVTESDPTSSAGAPFIAFANTLLGIDKPRLMKFGRFSKANA
jgi:pilus assembly protein CpaE